MGFQMKGRCNLYVQKIQYIHVFWQEEKTFNYFKKNSFMLGMYQILLNNKRREHESYRQAERQTDKFFAKKGGKMQRLGS